MFDEMMKSVKRTLGLTFGCDLGARVNLPPSRATALGNMFQIRESKKLSYIATYNFTCRACEN